jgi:hypothetical protein
MRFLLFLTLLSFNSHAVLKNGEFEDNAIFSGRISRLNKTAKLMRVRVKFDNYKFLNVKDRVEFWNDSNRVKRCLSFVEARSPEYMLVRVPNYDQCISQVYLTVGSYLKFYSKDLRDSLSIAKDLTKVLLKKRLALTARLNRYEKNLSTYDDKLEALNKRFEILRQKLELEWSREIADMEEDKIDIYKNYKNTEARLNELEHKIQAYKVNDHNFKLDRWSLDENLYIKK